MRCIAGRVRRAAKATGSPIGHMTPRVRRPARPSGVRLGVHLVRHGSGQDSQLVERVAQQA